MGEKCKSYNKTRVKLEYLVDSKNTVYIQYNQIIRTKFRTEYLRNNRTESFIENKIK